MFLRHFNALLSWNTKYWRETAAMAENSTEMLQHTYRLNTKTPAYIPMKFQTNVHKHTMPLSALQGRSVVFSFAAPNYFCQSGGEKGGAGDWEGNFTLWGRRKDVVSTATPCRGNLEPNWNGRVKTSFKISFTSTAVLVQVHLHAWKYNKKIAKF